jgi:hypothetical protein
MFGHKSSAALTAEVRAVVLKTTWITQNHQKAQYLLNLHLRVHFDDGSTAEFSSRYHHIASVGDVLTVRYDPDDHTKLELVDESFKEQRATRETHTKEKLARAEQQLTPGASSAAGPDPRIDVTRLSIRLAQRKGDTAEAARLTTVLQQLESGTFVAPASGTADPLDRIQKLAELHSSGALTDEEFAAQKARLLQA